MARINGRNFTAQIEGTKIRISIHHGISFTLSGEELEFIAGSDSWDSQPSSRFFYKRQYASRRHTYREIIKSKGMGHYQLVIKTLSWDHPDCDLTLLLTAKQMTKFVEFVSDFVNE